MIMSSLETQTEYVMNCFFQYVVEQINKIGPCKGLQRVKQFFKHTSLLL